MNQAPSTRQLLQAFLAQPQDPRLGLFAGEALYRDGHSEAAVALWSLADDADPRVRRLSQVANAPEQAREVSDRADRACREFFTALHRQAVDEFQGDSHAAVQRVGDAIWPMTHDAPFEWQTELQQPVIFYLPDLPALPVTPNAQLHWAQPVAAAWGEILEEYQRAMSAQINLAPYVPEATRDPRWQTLRGTLDWSAIHLYREGQRTAHADAFPRTLAALEQADLVRVNGAPMEIFFSRLTPGAHIPPHFGLTNTRLTTHLPLVVPDNCAIRVGSETHHWQQGVIIAFDDSFEHEAWNRSDSDRVVLIFETHHPDLSEAERAAIESAYAARHQWLGGRRHLLEQLLADLG
ncbi:aspartyl/asparaginyl beta-hydroxylase domain-containing protein [Parahaliea maris]|uniref:Aspartyl/asparaginyl beta-hydroxylase domain-containing protein n=1 Tax=Parahaliea maris TaxID=2716870 RepID=A0A5C9A6N4_9GAMM|nr:aspartyl/asparaginyl beta-hydroxylase domain-containing protein [Parahaliea maris]TXS95237.1 aspartyl/asparaginyl beta-hydroxylase domain-containing protein [Parahaliea maris]